MQRIKNEHPDDAGAVMNDRVKGSLKVTRAFGAGFLKQVGNLFKILCIAFVWIVLLKKLAALMLSYYTQRLSLQCNVEYIINQLATVLFSTFHLSNLIILIRVAIIILVCVC